jgi:hypothetical protein
MPTKRGKVLQAKDALNRLKRKHRRFDKLVKAGRRMVVDAEGNITKATRPAPLPTFTGRVRAQPRS